MDRRQFLKTVAVGAGTALVPSAVFAFVTEKSFHPGFDGKRFSLVWRGDNYHCYYTDKTFIVAHKAEGVLPVPANCPDPNYTYLKENSFDHLLDKNRITIETEKLLEMIYKSGSGKTPYQFYKEEPASVEFELIRTRFEAIDGVAGGRLRRATNKGQVSLIVNRYNQNPDTDLYSNIRYFYSKYHQSWVGANIDSIRNMLKSAPSTVSMAFNDKILSFASPDGSWAAFLAVLINSSHF
jgi:hypothetical protein